jgi:hypothetical protein
VALTIDWENKLINVTSPQTDVLVQDLIDFIRTEEPCCEGIAYGKVANASGKDSLGGCGIDGITLTLLDDWQLKFWDGSYTATISGGNLIGGPGGDPVAYTAGVQVVIIQSAASDLGIDVVATLNPTVHTRATDRAVVSVKARSGVRVDSEASQLVPLPSKVTRRVKIRTTPRKSVTIGEQE